jgi:hypothetical protein
MSKMSEKQAVMRLKLWLFRLKNNKWPVSAVLTERKDFEPFLELTSWVPIKEWMDNPETPFPEETVYDLMERVVYARG